MEFSISKQNLMRVLGPVYTIADRKTAIPILSTILVQAEGDTVQATATDMYRTRACTTDATVSKGGSAAFPGKRLYEIAKNLPDAMVEIKVEDMAAEIRCGKTRYKILTLSAEEFPQTPQFKDAKFTTVAASVVSGLVGLVRHAMCTTETRMNIHGALFESDGQTLRMVSTDGHRMAKAEVNAEAMEFHHLVPYKGIEELRKIVDDAKQIEFAFDASHLFVKGDRTLLVVKLSGEHFPSYKRLLPQNPAPTKVTVERVHFFDALKRVDLVTQGTDAGVRLVIEPGVMKLFAESADVGTGAEEVGIDLEGEAVTIGFSAQYLLETLGVLNEDRVTFEVSEPVAPGIIRPVGERNFVGLVMPMRV